MFSWNWIIRFHWILAWCSKLLWDCAWQPNFFAQKLGEWAKNRLFDFKEKSGHSFSLNLFHKFFFLLFDVFLHKSYIWEKYFSWDIGQNALSQSDCRIFKSSISPEQIDETASFLSRWCKFTTIKSWMKIFYLGMVKNGFDQSSFWTPKLTLSQEWNDWKN